MSEGCRGVVAALQFAAERHVDQRRKGARGEPYVNHLIEVVDHLAEATGGDDAVLLMAAALHDVVEDTPTTLDEVEALFGAEVAAVVAEVTDDKSLPKAERKRLQVETTPTKSRRAKLLKLADKISNVQGLATSPPPWPDAQKRAYVVWAQDVVAGCRGTSPTLEAVFDAACTRSLDVLDAAAS